MELKMLKAAERTSVYKKTPQRAKYVKKQLWG